MDYAVRQVRLNYLSGHRGVEMHATVAYVGRSDDIASTNVDKKMTWLQTQNHLVESQHNVVCPQHRRSREHRAPLRHQIGQHSM